MSMSRMLTAVMLLGTSSFAMAQAIDVRPIPVFGAESGSLFVPKSIIGQNSLVDITTLRDTATYDMASIVARVEDSAGDGFCSGSRIAEDLFLTNYHCWEYGQADVLFHMGYENGRAEDQQATFRSIEVIDTFEQLDYAIYRVERVDTNAVDFPTATLSKQELIVGMPLLVPGHPAARTKEVDVSAECALTRAVPYDFYDRLNIQHQCDTEGGSSGSPILDRETGNVIGLHWGATAGTPSTHAIPMNLILSRLEEMFPAVYAELTVVE